MRRFKTLLAFAIATVAFGVLTDIASARNYSYSETRFTATYFSFEWRGGVGTTRCNVTLANQLHTRTMPKVLESLVGLITAASVGGCSAGSATVLGATLPWHIRYAGFGGTLPNISQIRTKIVGWQFRVREPFGVEYLETSTASSPTTGTLDRENGGRVSDIQIGGTVETDLGVAVTHVGFSVSVTPAVTVTLI